MKIGYFLLQFPVLSQTFINAELVELTRQGHELTIFALTRPIDDKVQPEITRYGLLQRTFYLPWLPRFGYRSISNNIKLNASAGKMFGGESPSSVIIKLLADLFIVRHFASLTRRLEVDVLHTHFYGTATALTALIAKQAGIPFTCTCHAVDIYVNTEPQVMRKHFEAAFRVITPSEYNRRYLHELTGINRDKISVVRACAVMDKFRGLPRRETNDTLITVGRLVEKKGINYAIEAFAKLIKEFPSLRYRIIGSGPAFKELDGLRQTLGIGGQLQFLGDMAGDSEFLNELSRASIAVMPCIRTADGDQDVCPVFLQEAMCAGIPVVSSSLASMPELLEDGCQGRLVEPRNAGQLAEVIRMMLLDPQRNRMGEAAQRQIYEKFNIQKEVGKLLDIWVAARASRYHRRLAVPSGPDIS